MVLTISTIPFIIPSQKILLWICCQTIIQGNCFTRSLLLAYSNFIRVKFGKIKLPIWHELNTNWWLVIIRDDLDEIFIAGIFLFGKFRNVEHAVVGMVCLANRTLGSLKFTVEKHLIKIVFCIVWVYKECLVRVTYVFLGKSSSLKSFKSIFLSE